MYDARVIANELLKTAWQMDLDLTQLEVQKICYFLNGHHIVDHGIPLILTEFEAWTHGPVQRTLYDAFKRFGDGPITEMAVAFDPIRRKPRELPSIESNSVKDTIERYLPRYLGIPAHELVGITHRRGTPWHITMTLAESTVNIGMKIATETIAKNFEGLSA